jgi:hypothetical protein
MKKSKMTPKKMKVERLRAAMAAPFISRLKRSLD